MPLVSSFHPTHKSLHIILRSDAPKRRVKGSQAVRKYRIGMPRVMIASRYSLGISDDAHSCSCWYGLQASKCYRSMNWELTRETLFHGGMRMWTFPMRCWVRFIGIYVFEYSDQMSVHSAYLCDKKKIGNLSHPLEVFRIKN